MDNDLLPSIAAVDDVYIASLVPGHNYNSNNGHGNGNHNLGNHHLHHNNVAQFENALDESEDSVDETTYPPPVFDFGMPRNITARTGHTAAINCRVENLRDKSVSQMENAYLPKCFFLRIHGSILCIFNYRLSKYWPDWRVVKLKIKLPPKLPSFGLVLLSVCSATCIVFRFRSLCPWHHHLISHHIFWSFSCSNDRVSVSYQFPVQLLLRCPRLRLPLPVYCSFVHPMAFATLLSLVYGFALCFIFFLSPLLHF